MGNFFSFFLLLEDVTYMYSTMYSLYQIRIALSDSDILVAVNSVGYRGVGQCGI